MEAVGAPVEKKERRNVMKDIRRRLNSNAYNKTRNLKRNERNVREKLRAFEKKGELKGYMAQRYDEALDLLGRLEEIKEVGAGAAPAPEPIAVLPPAAVATATLPPPRKKFTLKKKVNVPKNEIIVPPAPPAAPKKPRMTLKKLNKQRAAAAAAQGPPEFVLPPANRPAKPIPYGEYNREGEFHVRGAVSPNVEVELGEAPENIGRFGYVPKEKGVRVEKLPKKTRLLTEEEMKYLERVYKSFLPLPELYNPFTGVKYGPENDPQDNIDRAHYMLLEIQEKAKRKALALKRREEKKTVPRAGI